MGPTKILFWFVLIFCATALLAGSVKVGVKLLLCDAFWETGYGSEGREDHRKVKQKKIQKESRKIFST